MDAKSHSRETKRLRLQRILEDHAVGVEEPKCQGQDYGLSGSADSSDAFVIVIMTYKRVGKLEKTLNFLSQFGMGGSLSQNFVIDIIITQTCDTDDPDSVSAVENLIQRVNQKVGEGQAAPFRSIKHVKVSLMKFDDSYSTDKKMYGNKRNSLQNLKNGLSVALARHPGAKDFFVLEDDAVVSCDVFEIIKFVRAKQQGWSTEENTNDIESDNVDGGINGKSTEFLGNGVTSRAIDPAMVTLDILYRPSLYVGNFVEDTSEYVLPSSEKRLNLVYVNPRTVIKTFAYVLKHKTARQYVAALDTVDTDADSFDQGGYFFGCPFCAPYCYDHVLEWMLQNQYIIAPDIPRTTQLAGKGMTYKENPLTPIYQKVVRQSKFYVSNYKHIGVSYFPIIGTSALTRSRGYFTLATQTTSQVWFWLLFACISAIVCCLKFYNNRYNSHRKWGRKKRS